MIKTYKIEPNDTFREKLYKIKVFGNLIADISYFILLCQIRTFSGQKRIGNFPILISIQEIRNAGFFFNSQKVGKITLICQKMFI